MLPLVRRSVNEANSAPMDWHNIGRWAFPVTGAAVNEQVWLAAVAEMTDRVKANNWSSNLNQVLFSYSPLKGSYLPLVVRG